MIKMTGTFNDNAEYYRKQDSELRVIARLAQEFGWNGVDNPKILHEFLRERLERAKYADLTDNVFTLHARNEELEKSMDTIKFIVNKVAR